MKDVAVISNEKNIVNEITTLHNEVKSLMEQTLDKGLRLGALLCSVKTQIGHGNFQAWIESNCPFKYRAARNYMLVSENKELLQKHCIKSLAAAFSLLADVKSARHALLTDDENDDDLIIAQFTEITDADLSDQEKELERLKSELEELKEARRQEKKEAQAIKKDNESYKKLITDMNTMREVIQKVQEIDKKPTDESLNEIAKVTKYITKAEKFFLKQTDFIADLPANKITIKAMSNHITKLLNAVDAWGVRVAKRFKVKLNANEIEE